ncbi:la-related protein 6 isoform X1 [Rana temporaria]|uniref:la-related protein 6 isoform X1 n=1 Tax=Rana temporaria TaxID=8407 RepID=UPI001AAC9D72|nr:la-related protein 6 isoform X1 [Rana temporaria]
MFRSMNTFIHCFLLLLPSPFQELCPVFRSEGKWFGCLCGKKKSSLCSAGQVDNIAGGSEAKCRPQAGPLSVPFRVWHWAAGHLCSPYLLQMCQKISGFPKRFDQMNMVEQPENSSGPEVGFPPSDPRLDSIEGREELKTAREVKEDGVDGSLEALCKEQEFVVGINYPTELEDDPDVLLGPELCSEIDIGLGYEDFTVYEPVTEPSLVAGECQTDEELTSFYGYLDDSVASTMVDFSSSTETDLWFPIETCGDLCGPVEWLNIGPAAGCPLEVDLGITSFPGIECYGIGDHLGQVIITTGPSDEVYHQSRHIEGGSSSDEDFRIDKASGAATSGGENDGDELDQDWKPPDSELIQKLVVQIEYYLSDENLEKDAFLLKHVRRNKMGFVSVKLLTSFKKVKHLTRDWRTTAYALRYSDVLELNEDNRKVRRKTPVPVFPSENLPSKMLLVYDLHCIPELHCLDNEQENGGMQEKIMEQLLKSFGAFGSISSIRILKPGRDLPSDVKRFSSRYAQVGTMDCAIVEFEEVEAAIKAHETLNSESETEEIIKVVLIGMKPPKKKIQKDRSKDDDAKNLRKNKSLNKRVEELQYVGDEAIVYSSSEPDSNPNSPMIGRKIPSTNKLSPSAYPNNHLSPNASPRNSPWSSPCGQRKGVKHSPLAESMSPETSRRSTEYSSDSSITPSSSPWVQRRRQAQTVTQEKSPACSPMLGRKIQNADGLPPGVLRLPRGPDGTKGFHNGIERNKLVQES